MLSPTHLNAMPSIPKPQAANWRATLDLDFAKNPHWQSQNGQHGQHGQHGQPDQHGQPGHSFQTRVSSVHVGPLRIQKALYPEGPELCHVIILHPPGGIAAGDELHIQAAFQDQSAALITTPGATRWYGSHGFHGQPDQHGHGSHGGQHDHGSQGSHGSTHAYIGRQAQQHIGLTVHGDCEWLPMETIVFDRAVVNSSIDINCSANGRMIGWDTLIFGRQSCGEDFLQGLFHQNISCRFDNTLVWQERTRLAGNDPMLNSAAGFQSHRAAGTFWAIRAQNQPWQESEIHGLRQQVPQIAWSLLWPRLLVGRLLGSPITIKEEFVKAWGHLRPLVFERSAIAPRIWAT
jgi:urease accessory protein